VSRVSAEKGATKRDRWLTDEEETRLLAVCSSWLSELVVFALHSGMRLGEILALTWAGVDLFRKTVTVFRSKNGERRTVPANGTVMALFKEKTKVRTFKTELVFPSRTGTPLDPNHLRRALRIALKRLVFKMFISTTSDTRLPRGWCNPGWICTRCNDC
jgi:integrase